MLMIFSGFDRLEHYDVIRKYKPSAMFTFYDFYKKPTPAGKKKRKKKIPHRVKFYLKNNPNFTKELEKEFYQNAEDKQRRHAEAVRGCKPRAVKSRDN